MKTGLDLIPADVRARFMVQEKNHACAILAGDFRDEFKDICDALRAFTLRKSQILTPGGRKTDIADSIDKFLNSRGWAERSFDTKIVVDKDEWPTPTHSIDNFKNRIGIEVEWNNKDPFMTGT